MLFKKQTPQALPQQHEQALSSLFGRGVTSIASAKAELFHEPLSFNPLDYLKPNRYFLGLDHQSKQPLYNFEAIHTQIVAPTRAGKGVLMGVKAVEALRAKKGLIIIDPKEDDFLPSVILEELHRQNRASDLIILNWSSSFGYTVFNQYDNAKSASKKLSIMLNLIESDSELGASFYRKSERIMLAQIIAIFFDTQKYLNITFEKTLQSLSMFIKYVIADVVSANEFEKESQKTKPNFDKLEQLSKRYFDPILFAKLDLNISNVPILESLQFSLSEFDSVTFNNQFDLTQALINNKVIYIKSDMLDETALKFLKLVIFDIIELSKLHKKKTNALVILDELSFYPTQILSAGLATAAGFGINFILAYQSEAQMRDENLRVAIKDNCQTKIYYKSSDDTTLKYIELLSGLELVSQKSKNGNDTTIRQLQEAHMNITRLRALPRAKVAILLEENLNEIKIFQTSPIPVKAKFDWDAINNTKIQIVKFKLQKLHQVQTKSEIILDEGNQKKDQDIKSAMTNNELEFEL